MASPGREFDPNRKYKIVLSERLKNNTNDYSNVSVQVDPDLKIPSSVKSSEIKRVGRKDDEWSLHLAGSKPGEKYTYAGNKASTKTCALTFDPSTQTFILDRIDTEFSFTRDETAGSDGSGSDDGILSALIEQEGDADPDNPYDWRHQLKRRRTSTPELEPFDPLSLDALGSPSPEASQSTNQRSYRQASTPPGEVEVDLEQEYEDELASQESSDDGGIQIVMDGANEPRNRFNRGRFFDRTEEGGPISLRSAANSKSPAVEQQSSEESDEDVDEMKLGSPMRKEEPEKKDEADADMGDEEELEAEFERALEDQFGDDDGGDGDDDGDGVEAPAARYVDDSSSESEEE